MATIRVYTRVSDTSQKLDSQLDTAKRWLRSQDEPAAYYSDEGFTRLTTTGRPGWAKLMQEVQPGDLVVFPQLDRAVADLGEYLRIRADLRKRKVGYHYIREGIGWRPGEEPNPFTEALEEILAVFGKLETRIRRKRQLAGIAAAKDKIAKGEARRTRSGRVITTWTGPRNVSPRKLSPAVVQTAKDMKAKRTSVAEIARVLKLARKTVYVALES